MNEILLDWIPERGAVPTDADQSKLVSLEILGKTHRWWMINDKWIRYRWLSLSKSPYLPRRLLASWADTSSWFIAARCWPRKYSNSLKSKTFVNTEDWPEVSGDQNNNSLYSTEAHEPINTSMKWEFELEKFQRHFR